jgi:hypothetical protein
MSRSYRKEGIDVGTGRLDGNVETDPPQDGSSGLCRLMVIVGQKPTDTTAGSSNRGSSDRSMYGPLSVVCLFERQLPTVTRTLRLFTQDAE